MQKGLFLDDIRFPDTPNRGIRYPEDVEWTIVRTGYEFVQAVEKSKFDIISFDQYLCDTDPGLTGEEVFLEFIQYKIFNEEKLRERIIFHSADRALRNKLYEQLDDLVIQYNL